MNLSDLYTHTPSGTQGDMLFRGSSGWQAIAGLNNVKSYGAVGNGTTDDKAAFVAAEATGKSIYVPPGSYKISSAMTTTSGSWIFSPGATIVDSTGTMDWRNSLLNKKLGFYANEGNGVNIDRITDRMFIGGAADISGNSGTETKPTWVGALNLGGADRQYIIWYEQWPQLASYSTEGKIAVAGCSRTSDNTSPYGGTVGVAGYGLNDNSSTAKPAWAFYGAAFQKESSSCTIAMELDTASIVDPGIYSSYNMTNGFNAVAMLCVGGEIPQGMVPDGLGGQLKNVSVGLGIANNETGAAGNRLVAGIVLRHDVLNSNNLAIEMARNHKVQWSYGTGATNIGAQIRSEVNSAAGQQRMVFTNGSLLIKGVEDDLTTETNLFQITAPTLGAGQETNYLTIMPEAAAGGGTGNVKIASVGTDTNVNMVLQTKGTGNFMFQPASGGSNAAILYSTGNLSLDGTLTENAWTLNQKTVSRKWELVNSILKAYKEHDGRYLDSALQVKTGNKCGKRPSDFIQIAIECIAELKNRIEVLENTK